MNHVSSLLLIALLFGIGCRATKQTNSKWAQNKPYVVMLSIDGFRHDYAEKHQAKNLIEMAKNGASAVSMIPSFPSKTFPNHYTIVTGLTPANHGIVGNSFYSREKKDTYSINDKETVRDGSWYGGTPLWVLAENNQMLSASYFWAGSEAAIQGVTPSYFEAYEHTRPNKERIDKVLEWLKLDKDERPHFVALYFSIVDDAGHDFGPESDELRSAVLEVDRLVGRLRKELGELGLPIYFIVTSDHGMTEINEGIDLSGFDFGDAITDFSSTMLMLYSENDSLLSSIKDQLMETSELTVLTKDEAGSQLGFKNDDRVGDLVVLSDPPFVILEKTKEVSGGTHGYDPLKFKDMHSIFYIEGPKINKGTKIETFKNVDVYPLIVDLLGLEVNDQIDGKSPLKMTDLKD